MRMRKSLGQHMLVSKRVVERIVSYAELRKDDVVLEVGCGTGNLTDALLKKCYVIGIEKDKKMVEKLRKRFRRDIIEGKFEIIHADALKIDFPQFNKFVSNIPYKISSPLTFKLFKYKFDLAIVMYQREFAERLCGEDSRLGIISKSYCTPTILELVKPSSFKPRPKVDSAIVKIVPKPLISIKNRELFEKFVTFAFTMRRKRMGRIVQEFNDRFGCNIEIDVETSKKRPEELKAKEFAEIVNDILPCRG